MRAADRELLLDLFGGLADPLAIRCAAELGSSPRFGAFLERYRGKIGRKARSVETPERWPDVWLELWAAARLLADRRFEVAYESFGAQKVRGPDLTLTFRTHVICHVEIKHVRTELSFAKWAEIVCTKLDQLPTGAPNVLLVGVGPGITESSTAETALRELGQRAQQGEESIFARYGLPSARDYSRRIPRLGGVLHVANWHLTTPARPTLWPNPTARHPLPPDLARALLANLSAAPKPVRPKVTHPTVQQIY
jgi:hypothetical protein